MKKRKSRFHSALLTPLSAFMMGTGFGCQTEAAKDARPPNVLIFLADISEMHNVYMKNPDIVAALEREYLEFIASLKLN